MKVALSQEKLTSIKVDLLALAVSGSNWTKDPRIAALDKAMNGALQRLAKDEGFAGKAGEHIRIPASGRVQAKWLAVYGMGEEPPRVANQLLGTWAARAVKKQQSLAVVATEDSAEAVNGAVQGIVGGAYRYTKYLTGSRKPTGGLKKASVLVSKVTMELKHAAQNGQVVAECVALARDLVNGPPNDINPLTLADVAKEQCEKHSVDCDVWDKEKIADAGMQLFLAVNRGSGIEPRMVHMAYKPEGAAQRVVFVGKGLTFDSGGLCIKPAKSMIDMKCDMAGAATTLGIVLAAARLKLGIEVHGVIGATENMTGEHAYRPGDIFTAFDGKTVEIINTDAEGRLVLADVLAWAQKLEPTYLIDHATLTGACMVALGPTTAGLFSNDDALAEQYRAAATTSGESLWRLPLLEDLKDGLKSPIADLKHTGDSNGGAISAALFLREFIGKCKWVHLDIAGPSYLERPKGPMPKGGTGFGIATGVALLEQLLATPSP